MCSTPQKQPAARVHFWALGGKEEEPDSAGLRLRDAEVVVVKGRRRRERKCGVEAMVWGVLDVRGVVVRRKRSSGMRMVRRRVRGERVREGILRVGLRESGCGLIFSEEGDKKIE